MIKKSKKYLSLMLASALLFSNMLSTTKVSAETTREISQIQTFNNNENKYEYEIYPAPQKIIYKEGSFSFMLPFAKYLSKASKVSGIVFSNVSILNCLPYS